MTKRWGPNCVSDLTKTKRRAAKQERASAKKELRTVEKQLAHPPAGGRDNG